MLKYAIHPGKVMSVNDGEEHYISYFRLIELYKLDPLECFNASVCACGRDAVKHLYPRRDGKYD